jgi:hypothetical protein
MAAQASSASPERSMETWGSSWPDQPDAVTFHVDVHAASAFAPSVAVSAIPATVATAPAPMRRRFVERR